MSLPGPGNYPGPDNYPGLMTWVVLTREILSFDAPAPGLVLTTAPAVARPTSSPALDVTSSPSVATFDTPEPELVA